MSASLTSQHKRSGLAALAVTAVGIVYGDIGTSPLYTMKEVFSEKHGLVLNAPNLLGVVSLIVWGLILVVSLKYVTLILRADNRGEGGIMALMALALSSVSKASRWYFPVTVIGLFGAALFAPRCFMVTASLRRQFRYSPPSRVWKSPRPC